MEDIFDAEITAEKKAEIIREFDGYLAAMQRIHEQMVKDQEEIDRITAETWAILAQMRKAA
ncbi:MAG: hypothetical protein ACREEM_21275 [Blastocatellia bacterium]